MRTEWRSAHDITEQRVSRVYQPRPLVVPVRARIAQRQREEAAGRAQALAGRA